MSIEQIKKDILAEKCYKNLKHREQKTKDEIEDKVDDNEFEKIYCIIESINNNYLEKKKLMANLRKYLIKCGNNIYLDEYRHRDPHSRLTTFNNPEPIPLKIRELLNIDKEVCSRLEVTKHIYKYINKNNMYDSKKKEIIPDKRMRRVFGIKDNDKVNFYNLQFWIKRVYNEK